MSNITVNFDPAIFTLGPLQIRWYGLMYVIGFFIGGELLKYLSKKKFFPLPVEKVDRFVFHLILGLLVGARFFYVFIYNWESYSRSPWEIFAVWTGGLSFHGAIAGFIVVGCLYAQKNIARFFSITDSLCLAGSQGLFFGRIGNFINGELYGRVTDVSWGMIFPNAEGPYPRHPSQLYEAFLEGIALFVILWILRKKVKSYGIITSVFFIGYGCFRFIVEFFREADSQLGYYFGGMITMGQILCFIMIILGIANLAFVLSRKSKWTAIPAEPS
jgi:phosphatidylglycerol:prolipoprotein diacylglycerol transferase